VNNSRFITCRNDVAFLVHHCYNMRNPPNHRRVTIVTTAVYYYNTDLYTVDKNQPTDQHIILYCLIALISKRS